MTRKEESQKAANEYCESEVVPAENLQMAYGDFLNGAKWADKTMIDKAVEWLKCEMSNYVSFEGEIDEEFVTDFRKAMEE